jgi:uncharacterized C2H2 Zn-finger protein
MARILIRALTKCYFVTVMEEAKHEERFCRCPFCPCVFITKDDLEKHMKTFGTYKERHWDEFRRCHSRAEYASEE